MSRIMLLMLALAAAHAGAQPESATGDPSAGRDPCRDGRAWALVVGVPGEPLLAGERGWIPGERVATALTREALAAAAGDARRTRPADVLTMVIVASPSAARSLASEPGAADSIHEHVDRVFVVLTDEVDAEQRWEIRRGIVGEGLPVPSNDVSLRLTGLVVCPEADGDASQLLERLRARARRLPGDFDRDGCVEVDRNMSAMRVEGEDAWALREASLHVRPEADLNLDGCFDGDAGPPGHLVTQWGLDFMWFVMEARWSLQQRQERP